MAPCNECKTCLGLAPPQSHLCSSLKPQSSPSPRFESGLLHSVPQTDWVIASHLDHLTVHLLTTLTSSRRHWFCPSHLVSSSPAHALVYKTRSGPALSRTPVLAVTDMQFMDGTLINLFKPSSGQDLKKAIDNLNMDFGTLAKVDVDTSMY